jgi:tetratricopeptide (TPR) repeat protein
MSEGRSAPESATVNKVGKQRPLLVAVALLLVTLLVLHGPAALESLQANFISIESVRLSVTSPAIEADHHCRLLHAHGRAFYLQGRYEEAIAELERAAACNDYQWAWFDLGRAEYAVGRTDEAAVSWREAGAFGYAVALAQRAAAVGDDEASFVAWKVAALIDPAAPGPYLQIGRWLQTAGCPRQARALYQHLVDLDLDSETTAVAQSSYNALVDIASTPTSRCPEWR